ncbi:MAG: peroxiredoxin [Gaiellales bacterium]|nr:peroxiredoxin [Gaiellales bacterium]
MEFNHLLDDFHELGLEVVGISVDAAKTQAGFAAKHGFRFPMIGDKERKIGPLYGVMKNADGTGSTQRDTVVVGRDGIVVLAYEKVKAAGHAARVLEDVNAAREGWPAPALPACCRSRTAGRGSPRGPAGGRGT